MEKICTLWIIAAAWIKFQLVSTDNCKTPEKNEIFELVQIRSEYVIFGSVLHIDKESHLFLLSVIKSFKGPDFRGGNLNVDFHKFKLDDCFSQLAVGDTKLVMATRRSQLSLPLLSDNPGQKAQSSPSELAKLELVFPPLNLDRSVLDAVDFALKTAEAQDFQADAARKPEICGDKVCHPLAFCVSDSVSRDPECRCPECSFVNYKPVCANDGVTYTNECEVNRTACFINADLKVVYEGFCDLPDPCERLKCYHGAYCVSSPDKISARCVCPKDCPNDSIGEGSAYSARPAKLCGDNGRDYSSKCEIERDMCPRQRPIKVKFENSCDPCEEMRANNLYPCPRNTGGICRLDSNRTPYCACSSDQLFECATSDKDQLVCTGEGKTMTKCEAAQYACVYGKKLSIIANTACQVLQWGAPVCGKKCRHFSTCNVTQERQLVCTCNFQCGQEFAPVCGRTSGGNLKTFDNKCKLQYEECRTQSSIDIVFYGTCDYFIPAKNPCNDFKCSSKTAGMKCSVDRNNEPQCVCRKDCSSELFSPVCGSDMITYDNRCELEAANCINNGLNRIDVVLNSPCPALCAGRQCSNYARCRVVSLNGTVCECPLLDCTLWPTQQLCGSDNRNYSNICYLRQASCHNKVDIVVQNEGFCPPDLCKNFQCPFFGVCTSKGAERSCSCAESCDEESYDPVCSTQGINYPNLCSLKREACLKKSNDVKVNNKGFCDKKFALDKCKKRCEAPRECLILGSSNQVECTCRSCSDSDSKLSSITISTNSKTLAFDESSICTESGQAFASLCELRYSECMMNQTYRITSDRIICDIKNSCFGDDSSLIYQDDLSQQIFRCTNNSDCPVGAFCERTTCCSTKSWMLTINPPCSERRMGCCKDNYSPSKGFNYEGCPEYCDCDPFGAYSDLCDEQGQCLCKAGVTGKRCDSCKPFFWGFQRSVYFTGCKKCVCEEFGTDMERLDLYEGCDKVSGNCPCKYPARGQNCSVCPTGQTLMFMGCAQIDRNVSISAKSCSACLFGSSCFDSNSVNSTALIGPTNGDKSRSVTCMCPSEDSCRVVASKAVVCGNDGITYSSECLLKVTACRKQSPIKVVRKLPCEDFLSPCQFDPCPASSVCVLSDQRPGFACLCPYGTEGSNCQLGAFIETPSFSGLSYLMFPFQQLSVENVELSFMSRNPSGLLFLICNTKPEDFTFFAVYLQNFKIKFKYIGVSETLSMELPRGLQPREWSRIKFGFDPLLNNFFLSSVDQSKSVFVTLSKAFSLNVMSSTAAMGNVPSTFDNLSRKRILEFVGLDRGLDGCISQLILNGINTPLSYPSPMPFIQGLDIHPCSEVNPCDRQPCVHNGTCVAIENGGEFNCMCPHNYAGLRCEKEENMCDVKKCQLMDLSSSCELVSRAEVKCICPLNIAGEFCETKRKLEADLIYMPDFSGDSFLKLQRTLPSSQRFQIDLTMRIKRFDANPRYQSRIILYNGPANSIKSDSDFFLLYLDKFGVLNAKWNYGDLLQSMQLPDALEENRWHEVSVIKSENAMKLLLNGDSLSVKTMSTLRIVDLSTPLYVGGYPRGWQLSGLTQQDDQFVGLNGTIQRLLIDGERLIGNMTWDKVSSRTGLGYRVGRSTKHACFQQSSTLPCVNGGTCLPIRDEYLCKCQIGFEGKHCETDVAEVSVWQSDSAEEIDSLDSMFFNGSYGTQFDYQIFPLSEFQDKTDIDFRLKTKSANGIIMRTSPQFSTEYLSVELLQGFLQVSVDLGAGVFSLVSQTAINDNNWHQISIKRNSERLWMQIDKDLPMVTYGPPDSKKLDTRPAFFVGMVEKSDKPSFSGCLKQVLFNAKKIPIENSMPRSCN